MEDARVTLAIHSFISCFRNLVYPSFVFFLFSFLSFSVRAHQYHRQFPFVCLLVLDLNKTDTELGL